jgi:four helix bundle protein
MFLQLSHQKLDIYKISRAFVKSCYRVSTTFPTEEKFNMISQVRRAALSVHLNIAEEASRKSEVERKRFYEIARGSAIEIDAALDIAEDMGYCAKENMHELGEKYDQML